MNEPNESAIQTDDQDKDTKATEGVIETAEGALDDAQLDGVAGGLKAGTSYVTSSTLGG